MRGDTFLPADLQVEFFRGAYTFGVQAPSSTKNHASWGQHNARPD